MTRSNLMIWSFILGLGAAVMHASGAEITPTRALNGNAITDTAYDANVALISGDDTLMATWRSQVGISNSVHVAKSLNGGISWTEALSVETTSSNPLLAYRGHGDWSLFLPGSNQVTISTDNGQSWTSPTNITAQYDVFPFFFHISHLASDNNGTLLVEKTGQPDHVKILKSVNGGLSWTEIGSVPDPNARNIVHVGSSNWICKTLSNQMYLSANGGVTWNPVNLPTSMENLDFIELDSDHNNTLFCAFRNNEYIMADGIVKYRTFISRSDDNGNTWSEPAVVQYLDVPTSPPMNPAIIPVTAATFILRDNNVWDLALVNCFEYNAQVLVLSSTDNGLTWSTPEQFMPDQGSWYGDPGYPPLLSNVFAGAQGNIVTAWEDRGLTVNGLYTGSEGDIYYRVISDDPIVTAAQDWQLFE